VDIVQPKPRLGNNKELAQAAADHTMPHTLILVTVKSCDRGNMGKLTDTKPNQKSKSEKQIRTQGWTQGFGSITIT
jgi:hypothetical protein